MNVPQLRFSGFEDTWSKKKIKEIAVVTSGLTPLRSRNDFFKNGTIPWVKTMDLNNSIIKDTQEYVNEVAMKETSLRLLPANTLLIAMYGGFNQIGRTGIISFTGTTNQAISALTPKENSFSPFFLQSYLNFNVEKWKRLAASSRKDPNITKSDIENFFVRLPSIAEQDKMASFFKLIEQKIEKQQEKIEKLEQFKKGMMQMIFSQELRFKDKDGGEFPEWEEKLLNQISIINPKTEPLQDQFYYIDLESVDKGRVEELKIVNTEDAPSRAQRVLMQNDVLFQTVRPYQQNHFYVEELSDKQLIASTGFVQIRTNQNSRYILFDAHREIFTRRT